MQFIDIFDESQLETFAARVREFDASSAVLFNPETEATSAAALLWKRWMRDLGLAEMASVLDTLAISAEMAELQTQIEVLSNKLARSDLRTPPDYTQDGPLVLTV